MAIVSSAEIAKMFDQIRDARDAATKRAEAAEAQRDELAAQLATVQAEIGRLNQQLAQIIINSVRTP